MLVRRSHLCVIGATGASATSCAGAPSRAWSSRNPLEGRCSARTLTIRLVGGGDDRVARWDVERSGVLAARWPTSASRLRSARRRSSSAIPAPVWARLLGCPVARGARSRRVLGAHRYDDVSRRARVRRLLERSRMVPRRVSRRPGFLAEARRASAPTRRPLAAVFADRVARLEPGMRSSQSKLIGLSRVGACTASVWPGSARRMPGSVIHGHPAARAGLLAGVERERG